VAQLASKGHYRELHVRMNAMLPGPEGGDKGV